MASEDSSSLSLSFFLSFTHFDPSQTRPDPDHNSATRPERILLLSPLVIGPLGEALFSGEHEKQGRPPASKAAVESMAAVEIGEDELGECAICLEDWKIGGRIVKEMPCKHRFHGDCVEKWLGIHGSCPVCRFEMPCEEENGENKSGVILMGFSFGGRNHGRSSLIGDSDSD